MVSLGLKILGIGLAGSALSYGAYLGIEDIKGKASTDYPDYYGNRYREIHSNTNSEDNMMLKYGEEEKGKFLYNYKKLSFGGKKENSKETHSYMETSSVSSDEITKAKSGVTSDSDAINTLLKDVDSNGESRKDENRFSGLSEEGKKYRELCIVMLRKYVMNSKGNKNVLEDKCLFNATINSQFKQFKSQNTDYSSISTDTDYGEKIITFKTPISN